MVCGGHAGSPRRCDLRPSAPERFHDQFRRPRAGILLLARDQVPLPHRERLEHARDDEVRPADRVNIRRISTLRVIPIGRDPKCMSPLSMRSVAGRRSDPVYNTVRAPLSACGFGQIIGMITRDQALAFARSTGCACRSASLTKSAEVSGTIPKDL